MISDNTTMVVSKKKTFEISIKSTEFNEDMLGLKVSNIDEFFDVIDW